MTYTIAELAVPASDDIEPNWILRQANELERAVSRAEFGHDHFVDATREQVANYVHQTDSRTVLLVAVELPDGFPLPRAGATGHPLLSIDADDDVPEGRVLGIGNVSMPTHDNLTLAYVWAVVERDHQRQGIGTALADALDAVARAAGRTVLQTWTDSPVPDDADEVVVPKSQHSSIQRNAAAAFLLGRGFELEQVERLSQLTLPADADLLNRLDEEAAAKSAGYRVETFAGRTPERWIEPICILLRHFTVEQPTAGLESEEEEWTPERYRAKDEQRAAKGRLTVTAMAVHEESGEVVAMTEFSCPTQDHREVVYQNITIVDSRHRGRRLGLLTKLANVRQLQEQDPGRTVVYTWNAHENAHMLAINDAMGFVETSAEGAWQKRCEA